MSDFEVLRRIAERGLSAAQKEEHSEQIDCWQHMLDEIERTNKLYHPSDDMVTVGVDLEDDIILEFALRAHQEDVTLNHYLNRALMEMIERMGDEMGIDFPEDEDTKGDKDGTSNSE